MDNLARKLDNDPVFQDVGTVMAVTGASFALRASFGKVDARRAVSCLIEPREGDRVLFGGNRREGHYILAILARQEGAGAAVCIDGNLELRLPNGRFVVAAQEGVEVVSTKDVSVVSGAVHVNAAEGNVGVERLTFFGSLVRAEIETVKLLADRVDSVVERLSQRLKRSFRSVEESDQVRASHIDYTAKKTMSLHAGNALVTAEELVKLDGEQIHVG